MHHAIWIHMVDIVASPKSYGMISRTSAIPGQLSPGDGSTTQSPADRPCDGVFFSTFPCDFTTGKCVRPNLGGHEGNDQETQPGIGVSRVMCSAIVANMKRNLWWKSVHVVNPTISRTVYISLHHTCKLPHKVNNWLLLGVPNQYLRHATALGDHKICRPPATDAWVGGGLGTDANFRQTKIPWLIPAKNTVE